MKNDWMDRFVQCARLGEPLFADGEIRLVPREWYGYSRHIHSELSFIFDVVRAADGQIAGEIALRIGDSPEQFYLGHIGYHVDEPFRGHGYARRACLLAAPLLRANGMRTVVITTDPDNWPSVRTCENLGCVLESTVSVPEKMIEKLEISSVKHRFIWTLTEPEPRG